MRKCLGKHSFPMVILFPIVILVILPHFPIVILNDTLFFFDSATTSAKRDMVEIRTR